jgi:dihydroorotate dehydrogenase (NAD+) catalytic subunit
MIKPSLEVNICGISFKNPVIAASGTFGSVTEYNKFIDINGIGGISVKGITLHPKKGNPPPRIAETPSGILNSVGLQNLGVDAFIEKELTELLAFDTRIIANINGNTLDEYCQVAEKLKGQPVDFIELNISCPNVEEGGAAFGAHPDMVYRTTKAVKACCGSPLIVKLTPNTADIRETAAAAQEGGCDAISLINTVLGMAIDARTRRPVLGNITGGLSGPAIKPIALRMVWQAYQAVTVPIIGMGGISCADDAVEFLLAGASAVSVGTASLTNPTACTDIAEGLESYLEENGIQSISELTGGLLID